MSRGQDISHAPPCASGCAVECRICNRELAGSNLDLTKISASFHPSEVGIWVPAIAGKAKAGMAHCGCGWTCGWAGKTVKSLENTWHTWALLRWWFTTKRLYIKCMHFYIYLTKVILNVSNASYWYLQRTWYTNRSARTGAFKKSEYSKRKATPSLGLCCALLRLIR